MSDEEANSPVFEQELPRLYSWGSSKEWPSIMKGLIALGVGSMLAMSTIAFFAFSKTPSSWLLSLVPGAFLALIGILNLLRTAPPATHKPEILAHLKPAAQDFRAVVDWPHVASVYVNTVRNWNLQEIYIFSFSVVTEFQKYRRRVQVHSRQENFGQFATEVLTRLTNQLSSKDRAAIKRAIERFAKN